jgi:putative oxidoreductase
MPSAPARLLHVENVIHHQLVRHSITALRVAVGAIFLAFGVLKYFPGISPAQNLTEAATDKLTLGLVPGDVAIVFVATLECFIGVCLLAGRWMRVAIWLLAVEFVGILSPLVLLPGRLFSGPHHAPTLEGQYVLKDIILIAAGMVIAAASFRGGRLVRTDLPPSSSEGRPPFVLRGIADDGLVAELCVRHGIAQADYYKWRALTLDVAALALTEQDRSRPLSS